MKIIKATTLKSRNIVRVSVFQRVFQVCKVRRTLGPSWWLLQVVLVFVGQFRTSLIFIWSWDLKRYLKFTLGPDAHLTDLVGKGRWINNISDEIVMENLYIIEKWPNCEAPYFAIYINVIAGSLCKQRPQSMQGSRQRCRGSGRDALRCWVSR